MGMRIHRVGAAPRLRQSGAGKFMHKPIRNIVLYSMTGDAAAQTSKHGLWSFGSCDARPIHCALECTRTTKSGAVMEASTKYARSLAPLINVPPHLAKELAGTEPGHRTAERHTSPQNGNSSQRGTLARSKLKVMLLH